MPSEQPREGEARVEGTLLTEDEESDLREAASRLRSPTEGAREAAMRAELERLRDVVSPADAELIDAALEPASTPEPPRARVEAIATITQAVQADNADHFTHGELYGIIRDVQAALEPASPTPTEQENDR